MKFNLLNLHELSNKQKHPCLFFMQLPLSSTLLETFQVEALEPLLREKINTTNSFVSTYHDQTDHAVFMLDDSQKNLNSIIKIFEPCFQWLKKQENSTIYIYIGTSETNTNNVIDFIVKEYSNFAYDFISLKHKNKDIAKNREIFFVVEENKNSYLKTMHEAVIIADNIQEAKNLANLPSNICTPCYLANFAKTKAKELGVKCTIFNQQQIKEIGMDAFLSVAKGSVEEPYFIQLEYHGHNAEGTDPVVLIGKGITFDSGGISLKPAKNMDEMKYDMCGAANVMLTFFTAVELKLPINLVTLVPTCENMPSDRANKPGDIVQSLKGLSIEILNTDAEGRLILCDALTYAEQYKPKAIIDVATLTGACAVALGEVASGILGNQQELINALLESSEQTQDKAWQLPLWEEYNDDLKSNFADLANIGSSGYGGTITAAAFLSQFIEKQYPWAHIDIAATAWKSGTHKGATGRPIKLLVNFLQHQSDES